MTAIGAASAPIAGVGMAGRKATVAERGCAPRESLALAAGRLCARGS
jgi:hypothetical protein